MTEIQGGRWDDFLKRVFPVKAQGVAPAVGPEIVPIIEMEPRSLRHRILANEKTYAMWASQAEAAGKYAQIGLYNPTDSGMLLEVIKVWGRTWLSTSLYIAFGSTNYFDTQNVTYPLDARIPNATAAVHNSVGQFWYGSNANTSAHPWYVMTEPSHAVYDMEYLEGAVVPPGFWLYLRTGAVNKPIEYGGMIWREVPATPAELHLGY